MKFRLKLLNNRIIDSTRVILGIANTYSALVVQRLLVDQQLVDFMAARKQFRLTSRNQVLNYSLLSISQYEILLQHLSKYWQLGLPQHVKSASSLQVFKSRLKTRLFKASFV